MSDSISWSIPFPSKHLVVNGWLPVGLENLDSYLNIENLKLRKLQVSDSKPERLLQIKVNLEMVFVYQPHAYIANFNMHVQYAKFYFLQPPPSERPREIMCCNHLGMCELSYTDNSDYKEECECCK